MTDKPEAVAMISGLDALKISRDIVQAFLSAALEQQGGTVPAGYLRDMKIAIKVLSGIIKAGEDAPDPDDVMLIKVPE